MPQAADTRTAVHIRHHCAASPASVFDAWLAPQQAALWLFATASRPMRSAVIDARSGGSFSFVETRAGATIEHRGRYLEVLRPQRLVLLLNSPDCAPKEVPLGGALKEVPLGGATHDTRVSVTLRPLRSGCELRLLHEGVPATRAGQVRARWEGMFYGLESLLAQSCAEETI